MYGVVHSSALALCTPVCRDMGSTIICHSHKKKIFSEDTRKNGTIACAHMTSVHREKMIMGGQLKSGPFPGQG